MKTNLGMSAFLHIMVNYRNELETETFVKKCLQIKGADKGLFIIVNNSAKSADDRDFSAVIAAHPHQVRVLNSPDNPGYFPAAQRAFKGLDATQFQFVILSNTDLEILNTDFYEILLGMAENSEVGAIAPSIRSELSEGESNPLYWNRPTKKKIHFLKLVYSNYFIAWLYHVLSFFKARVVMESSILPGQSAYAAHGCFLILTKKYFQAGGDFSHGVRLYGEEIVLAEKLRGFRLKVILEPHLRIFHREKGTEISWWHRATLSKRTFKFKREAACFLDQTFDRDDAGRKSQP